MIEAFPWSCPRCERRFTHARFMSRHYLNVHIGAEPPFIEDKESLRDLEIGAKPNDG